MRLWRKFWSSEQLSPREMDTVVSVWLGGAALLLFVRFLIEGAV